MKTMLCRHFQPGIIPCLFLLAFVPVTSLRAQEQVPVINSIQVDRDHLVVNVDVPPGVRRVTLESRRRLDAQTWAPVAVRQLDGKTSKATFRLRQSQGLEVLRVRADFQQPLPQSFYTGTNQFGTQPTNSAPWNYYDVVTAGPGREENADKREVAESDIWKLNGDRLYFFNQYRGLQVLDISQPDKAKLLGTWPVPASGEQMYLADPNNVVLLARQGCNYGDQSQVMVVGVTNGEPKLLKTLEVPGYIQESRMVGTALYVAAQTYKSLTTETNTIWEWGTMVLSFDLADPAAPVARDRLWFPGYGQVVTATDTFLFVATQNPATWRQSDIRIIDITAPDGTMVDYASLTAGGQVMDKFKMNYADGVFTVISEDRPSGTIVTRLETFRLFDPRTMPPVSLVKLGSLELGKGERLHATRFDGSKVYLVTFFQIDPLWVVDLSNPAQPRIAGAVEIPGWSTYIVPLGDRLVSVGSETNRVAVSLFDVSDPANPSLLSRVRLGQNYSWTEANYDEKAFTVLDEANLILVPYSGDTTNGWTSRVQVIDLLPKELVARGIIEHAFQPRRAAYSHDRVLSLSGSSLLSVDVEDRDDPQVMGETTLAWAADRVFVKEDHVLEINNGQSWWNSSGAADIRVVAKFDPEQPLGFLGLGSFPVTGAALQGERLYIVQSDDSWFGPVDETQKQNLVFSVVDVSSLPAISLLARTTNSVAAGWWGGQWEAIWPKADTIVWAGGGGGYWWGRGLVDGPMGRNFWPGWSSGGGQLVCFDVALGATPRLVSEVNLQTNSWWSFSSPFVSGTLVYLSHMAAGPVNNDPKEPWVQSYYLDVVDYTDAAHPTLRTPAPIPGRLIGLAKEGELLYTQGVHWQNDQTDWREWLDASAYDGVGAHLVASLALPEAWPRPLLVSGEAVILGRSENVTSPGRQLESWTLNSVGEFTRVSALKLESVPHTLILRDGLLAGQDSAPAIQLFDATDPFSVKAVGQFTPSACLWPDISSAQGSLRDGLWVPMGFYGALHIPVKSP